LILVPFALYPVISKLILVAFALNPVISKLILVPFALNPVISKSILVPFAFDPVISESIGVASEARVAAFAGRWGSRDGQRVPSMTESMQIRQALGTREARRFQPVG
jgi:hypothetical protein